MTKTEVKDLFLRYRTSLEKEGSTTDVFKAFQRMKDIIIENCDDKHLQDLLSRHVLAIALRTIKERNINCKQQAGFCWSTKVTSECYDLAKRINDRCEKGDTQGMKVLLAKYTKIAEDCKKCTPLYLYVWSVYAGTDNGRWMALPAEDDREELKKFIDSPESWVAPKTKEIEFDDVLNGSNQTQPTETDNPDKLQVFNLYKDYKCNTIQEIEETVPKIKELLQTGRISENTFNTYMEVYIKALKYNLQKKITPSEIAKLASEAI